MKITGIICEYNPLHLGHKKQLQLCKANPEDALVCLMSGNFVQRGAPAILDRMVRAEAAVRCGADLVLELPITASLSSAEGFAAAGVSILSPFCHRLCFGAEAQDPSALMQAAQALLSDEFPQALRLQLDQGRSFPAARQAALEDMGLNGTLLTTPNNILAVEYCKAILSQGSAMTPWPIHRAGDYHNCTPNKDDPSATALRTLMTAGKSWEAFVPEEARICLVHGTLHTLAVGERAVLARLRTMAESEFQALPFGSEGLWRKLMASAREKATLEELLDATKSKRYTRSRLDRMVMCAFLGITQEVLNAPIPYVRVLAFNDRGREILRSARCHGRFVNVGQRMDHPWQCLEDRCSDLYGLFSEPIQPPRQNNRDRVFYLPGGFRHQFANQCH